MSQHSTAAWSLADCFFMLYLAFLISRVFLNAKDTPPKIHMNQSFASAHKTLPFQRALGWRQGHLSIFPLRHTHSEHRIFSLTYLCIMGYPLHFQNLKIY